MKRRGGDGGRTMVSLDTNDSAETVEMEELCSKLMSLIPHDYLTATPSQDSSSDMPSQLTQASTYIRDLRERVQQLKQRRDDCYGKIIQQTCSSRDN